MSYGGVPGHEKLDWPGRSKVATMDVPQAARMARKSIEAVCEELGYACRFKSEGQTRFVVSIVPKGRWDSVPVASFSFEAKRGGVVAVRLRRLAGEGVRPAQWAEHMPQVLRPEAHVVWSTGPEELPA